jgi:hypothetical protein
LGQDAFRVYAALLAQAVKHLLGVTPAEHPHYLLHLRGHSHHAFRLGD